MNVRAKFMVMEIKHVHTYTPGDTCATIVMQPVYDNGKANKDWAKYTPSGKLEMTVTNPKAIEAFNIGKEYYLDFSPAEVLGANPASE